MKSKTVFYCTECGNETGKWSGRCPACGAWNTLTEAPSVPAPGGKAVPGNAGSRRNTPRRITELDDAEEIRFSTGVTELDRVLGGGAVRGSLVLFGGAPGIGKSTLLLQICGNLAQQKVLYVTGEESGRQLKMRAVRLGAEGEDLYVLAETDINAVIRSAEELTPDILIIDSVQTMYNSDISSAPGSINQVKDATMSVMRLAKTMGITCFVVSHVNKEGAIAGWWTACCISKVTAPAATVSSEPPKTALARPMRSAYSRWRKTDFVRYLILRRPCLPEDP